MQNLIKQNKIIISAELYLLFSKYTPDRAQHRLIIEIFTLFICYLKKPGININTYLTKKNDKYKAPGKYKESAK